MLTWTALQPLPERLLELLDRAGAQAQRFGSRDNNTVIIFLPPHLVLGSKEICFRSFRSGFEELHALSQSKDNADIFVNGERLLGYGAEELKSWQGSIKLPRKSILQPVDHWRASMTLAILESNKDIENFYEEIEKHSEKGGSESDVNYLCRIRVNKPEQLIETAQNISLGISSANRFDNLYHQFHNLKNEFEEFIPYSRQISIENQVNKQELGRAEIMLKEQAKRIAVLEKLFQRQKECIKKLVSLQGRF